MTTRSTCIVNYGLGNLFSIQQACHAVGLETFIAEDWREIQGARAIILPGMGAFGVAVERLKKQGVWDVLKERHEKQTPLMGVCLGMQLLMSRSEEFGSHEGLGFIEGTVTRLDTTAKPGEREPKVPNIGWSPISPPRGEVFEHPIFSGVPPGSYFYFVHSFHVVPADRSAVIAESVFNGQKFCAALGKGHVVGAQFHPEKSTATGLEMYRNFAKMV